VSLVCSFACSKSIAWHEYLRAFLCVESMIIQVVFKRQNANMCLEGLQEMYD
jgi:hypothetical protein